MRKCENRARERALAYNFLFCLPAVDQKCARAQVFECDFLTEAIQTEIYFVEKRFAMDVKGPFFDKIKWRLATIANSFLEFVTSIC